MAKEGSKVEKTRIMREPLPDILSDYEEAIHLIKEWIARLEKAETESREAAKVAIGAAQEAKEAGQKAAVEAREAAEAMIAGVRDWAQGEVQRLASELAELESNVTTEVRRLDKRLDKLEDAIVAGFDALNFPAKAFKDKMKEG